MNLATLTIDLDTHVVLPIEPTEEWQLKLAKVRCEWDTGLDVIADVIAAAPPYQSEQVNCQGLLDSWIPCSARFPEVATGKCKEFIATYFEPYSSKLSVGIVSYLNSMDVPDEDTESDEAEISLSGWFATEKNDDGDEAWFRRSVIGWMNKPDAMPLTAPKGEE